MATINVYAELEGECDVHLGTNDIIQALRQCSVEDRILISKEFDEFIDLEKDELFKIISVYDELKVELLQEIYKNHSFEEINEFKTFLKKQKTT